MSKPLTIKEAAARLGRTPEALRLWRKAGKGPRWIMSGDKPMYPADALAEYMVTGEGAGLGNIEEGKPGWIKFEGEMSEEDFQLWLTKEFGDSSGS